MSFSRSEPNAANTADSRAETSPADKTVLQEAQSIQDSIDQLRDELALQKLSNAKIYASLKRSKKQQIDNEISTIDAINTDDVSEETKKLIEGIEEQTRKKIKIKNNFIEFNHVLTERSNMLSKIADETTARNQSAQRLVAKSAPVSVFSNPSVRKK